MSVAITGFDQLVYRAKRAGHFLGDCPADLGGFAAYDILSDSDEADAATASTATAETTTGLRTLDLLPPEL